MNASEASTITIQIGNTSKEITVPRSWDDLDKRTALLYYQTLFTTSSNSIHADAFTAVKLISITGDILGMGPDFLPRWEADCIAEDAEYGHLTFLEELKQVIVVALKGLFEVKEDEEGGTSYAVKFNRTKNLWPALTTPPPGPLPHREGGRREERREERRGERRLPDGKDKMVWYYAPKDGLENLTLYELAYTFGVYEAFVRTGDERLVNQLIGALYRPSRPKTREEAEMDWRGDRRQPLRNAEGMVTKRAKLAASLPVLTKRMIVFWFASCREAIIAQYPKVFVKAEDGKLGLIVYGWGGVLLRLAETGAFGELGQTSDTHFSNALTFLSMKEDERRRMEEEMEKAKTKRR